jgi:uncharacterized protein
LNQPATGSLYPMFLQRESRRRLWRAPRWVTGLPVKRLGLALVALLLVGYLAASVYGEQSTFHPQHRGDGPSPADFGMVYSDVSFKDGAGLTLRGWWVPGTKHRTVVMVHGWTSSRQEPMRRSAYLHAAGYNLLLFDLRGHGTSDGSYTTMGASEPDDVQQAVAFAQRRDPVAPVALIGYSMGASLAIETGAHDGAVVAVVEDSGYDSLVNVVNDHFSKVTRLPGFLAAGMLALEAVDLHVNPSAVRPIDDVAHLDRPLLVIIGSNDTMVPPAQGYRIFAAAPGPKQLLVFPGAGHVGGYYQDPATYAKNVLGFLDRAFGRAG